MATTVRYRIMEITNNTTMAICKHSVLCMSRDQSLHQRKTATITPGHQELRGSSRAELVERQGTRIHPHLHPHALSSNRSHSTTSHFSSPCDLTNIMRTTKPAKIRWMRLRLGKYGSSAPVIGFIIVMGAMAVNWGRGRSWEGGGKGIRGVCWLLSIQFWNVLQRAGPHLNVLKLRAVPAMCQGCVCPLPELQEQHCPQGHEDAEEDGPTVVKEPARLWAQQA